MEMLAIALQFIGSWVTLLITGHLFDLVNSETQATWKEDALVALMIVIVTLVVFSAQTSLSIHPQLPFSHISA